MTTPKNEVEREAFENWLTDGEPSAATERKALYEGLCGWDEYRSTHVQAQWEAWAKRADLAQASHKDQGWIETAERLPKAGSTVLAFWVPKQGPVHAGCWGVASYWPDHWHNPEDDQDGYIAPTFWQPIPASPSLPGEGQ